MAATEEPEASFGPASKPAAAAAVGHVLEEGVVEAAAAAAAVEGLGAEEAFRWGSGHSAC